MTCAIGLFGLHARTGCQANVSWRGDVAAAAGRGGTAGGTSSWKSRTRCRLWESGRAGLGRKAEPIHTGDQGLELGVVALQPLAFSFDPLVCFFDGFDVVRARSHAPLAAGIPSPVERRAQVARGVARSWCQGTSNWRGWTGRLARHGQGGLWRCKGAQTAPIQSVPPPVPFACMAPSPLPQSPQRTQPPPRVSQPAPERRHVFISTTRAACHRLKRIRWPLPRAEGQAQLP